MLVSTTFKLSNLTATGTNTFRLGTPGSAAVPAGNSLGAVSMGTWTMSPESS